MNINDQINELFKQGVIGITLSKTEQGQNIVIAEQKLPTKNGFSQFRHQVGGMDWPASLDTVREFAEHNASIQTKILRVN